MESITIIADKMVFGGDCIGKNNGKTVFIPFAIPGEKLEVEITDSKRDYDTAKIVRIVTPSEYRTEPQCPLYGKCGGCNMMHIQGAYQRELRMNILRDCFEREGIRTPEIEPVYGKETGYRCRFQFHDGGLAERNSNSVVHITNCPVAVPEINNWLAAVPQEKRPRGRIHVFGSSFADPSFIAAQEDLPKPRQETTYMKSGSRTIKRKVNQYFSGTSLNPANIASVQFAGKTVKFDIQGFFQSNIEVLEKAVGAICSGLSGNSVLDMYSGAGTFSVFLADHFSKVTLVEHNRDALVFAEMNMAGKKHESYGVSGEKWVKENAPGILKTQGPFDAVVIDPPRSGMERAVCSWLCETHPHFIRSVSCDPATHARDAAKLIHAGYVLKTLNLLDFYPETSHIESLACFEYNPS